MAHEFMSDLHQRLARRVQLTTDGLSAYVEAVEDVFSGWIDYAQLVKEFGSGKRSRAWGDHYERKYSPPGATERLWGVEDIVDLIEDATPAPGCRGPYRKRKIHASSEREALRGIAT